jgi:hypothetical protein
MSDSISNISKLCKQSGLPEATAFKLRVRVLLAILSRAQAVLSYLLSDSSSLQALEEHKAGAVVKALYKAAANASARLGRVSESLD